MREAAGVDWLVTRQRARLVLVTSGRTGYTDSFSCRSRRPDWRYGIA